MLVKRKFTQFSPITEAEEGEKLRRERQEDSIEAYEAAFQRISQITKETDLNKLVHKFIQVEDRNFALFNYVNEQNNEIEVQQDQIAEVGQRSKQLNSENRSFKKVLWLQHKAQTYAPKCQSCAESQLNQFGHHLLCFRFRSKMR